MWGIVLGQTSLYPLQPDLLLQHDPYQIPSTWLYSIVLARLHSHAKYGSAPCGRVHLPGK